MSLFALRDVTRRTRDGAREIAVLDGVSLEIDIGETIGVLGARRRGKTTLLRVAAGLEVPEEGEVCWDSHDLARMSEDERARFRRQRGIALASCDWRPVGSTAVLEHIATPLYSDGLRMGRAEVLAHNALERVNATSLAYQKTGRLGVRERVRVELACALAREPRLLLVDEPAVLARPSDAQELYALLHSLPKMLGLALVIASEEVTAVRGGRVMNLDGRLYSTDERRRVVQFPDRRAGGRSARLSAS